MNKKDFLYFSCGVYAFIAAPSSGEKPVKSSKGIHLAASKNQLFSKGGQSLFSIFLIQSPYFQHVSRPAEGMVRKPHGTELDTAGALKPQTFNYKKESDVFFFNDSAIIIITGFSEMSRVEMELYLSHGNVRKAGLGQIPGDARGCSVTSSSFVGAASASSGGCFRSY